MSLAAGIPLLELFELTDRIIGLLPPRIRTFLDSFAATGLESFATTDTIIHRGRLQSLAAISGGDISSFDIGIGTLELPLIHRGVPFQLSLRRTAAAAGQNLEPAPAGWQLDLMLDEFVLRPRGLTPARFVRESGTVPRHLLRDASLPPVQLIGAATLRLSKDGEDDVQVRFVDPPDPFDPSAPAGALAELAFSPPHFFIGSSELGLSIGRVQFDTSENVSPPSVLARLQGPEWTGMVIEEATVYAPRNLPLVGDLSAGVRNLLLGDPMGVQGEVNVQFGRSPLNPATFQFQQGDTPGFLPLEPVSAPRHWIARLSGLPQDDVTIRCGFTFPAPPPGSPVSWTARWRFPRVDAREGRNAEGRLRHGESIVIEPIEILGSGTSQQRFVHPEVHVRFLAQGAAPTITARVGGTPVANTIHLAGTEAAIGAVRLEAVSTAPTAGRFRWEILGTERRGTGPSWTPDVAGLENGWTIRLSETIDGEDTPRTAHLALTFVTEGRLLIGAEGGVRAGTAPATPLPLSALEVSFDLPIFQTSGQFLPLVTGNRLDPSQPGGVRLDPGSFSRVVVDEGGSPPSVIHDRHVQLLFDFERTTLAGWGQKRPNALAGHTTGTTLPEIQRALLAWAANYPGARFLVIGRCDDVGQGRDLPTPPAPADPVNLQLARDRAAVGRRLLTIRETGQPDGTLVANADVATRGETSAFDAASAAGPALEADPVIALTPAERSTAVGNAALANGWLIRHEHNPAYRSWANRDQADPTSIPIRQQFRRIDIYAVGGTPGPGAVIGTNDDAVAPTRRRSYIPGGPPAAVAVAPHDPSGDYRVKLKAGWDSPTARDFADAIPSLIEAEIAWSPTTTPLPPVGSSGSPPVSIPGGREVLTVHASWLHDPRTGFTRANLGIRSEGDPDGLVSITQPNLTAAAALGPLLLSGVDLGADTIGSAARIGALIGASAFAGALVRSGSRTSLISIEAQAETRALSDPGGAYNIAILTEYVCTLHLDSGQLGIKTHADHPMKLRYKRVGVRYDNTRTGWDKFGLAYATDSMEVESPGKWQINGVLGEVLRIVEVSMGRGSYWIELRVAAALDIGVVELSEAIFRLTWTDGNPIPAFELRGFVVKVDIAEVIRGEGRLRIEGNGIIRAGVEASIMPLGLAVSAGLAMGKPPEIAPSVFLELFLGVTFATPLPLAQSGAALYGLKGLFVANGSRRLPASPDPVGRELAWWREPPGNKYKPEKDQFAIGVGVKVGTMPDVSFCFSAGGMLVVGFPEVEVILGVDCEIVSIPNLEVTDRAASTGNITGLVVINREGVKVAVSAQYEVPRVLRVDIPFAANFPASLRGSYVRLGSDGFHGRHGSPVTLTLLPGTLDAQVWAYLMVEQDGLYRLGDNEAFTFTGFSVGFGAGWGIDWRAGPISLSASAKVLVGFGTNPLLIKGGVFVAGRLDLVVVSIAARGELILTYANGDVHLTGKFCGEVDLFFFSLKGCVGVQIGSATLPPAPPPPPPIARVSLTDRKDRVMGEAAPHGQAIAAAPLFAIGTGGNSGVAPSANNTVWADTAPVLHFSHAVQIADAARSQFAIPTAPGQPIWFGSNRLKYAYRIDGLRLIRNSDNAPVASASGLQSAWVIGPYRQPDASGSTANPRPSEHEGPNLKLLDWNPWNWAVNLLDGGAGTDGDPAVTAGQLCVPVRTPRTSCVFGMHATAHGPLGARLAPDAPPTPPYPSSFTVLLDPVLRLPGQLLSGRDLQTFAAFFGFSFEAGGVEPLASPLSHAGRSLTAGLAFARIRSFTDAGSEETPLAQQLRFSTRLADARITLLVCEAPGRPGGSQRLCTRFEGLAPGGRKAGLTHQGMIFTALSPNSPFIFGDVIDSNAIPPVPGRDGLTELHIFAPGLTIDLPAPFTQVELHIMNGGTGPIEAVAFDAAGTALDRMLVSGPAVVAQVLRLTGTGIARLRLQTTGGFALYQLCRIGEGLQPPVQPPPVEEPPVEEPPVKDPPETPERRCLDFSTLKPDRKVQRFTAGWVRGRALDPAQPIALVDILDVRGQQPVRGQDGAAELLFPQAGLELAIKGGCPRLEIGLLRNSPGPVDIIGFDARGRIVARLVAQGRSIGPELLRLESHDGSPIARIHFTGGQGEALVFRLCCLSAPARRCTDFATIKPEEKFPALALDGLKITALDPNSALVTTDWVDQQASPATAGRDGVAELLIPDDGLEIALDVPAPLVSLDIMLFAGPLKAAGFDAAGNIVASATSGTRQKQLETLTLRSSTPIARVALTGGRGEAVLLRICREAEAPQADGTSRSCIDFAGLDLARGTGRFSHRGLTFIDPSGRGGLLLMDNVDGPAPGADSVPELYALGDALQVDLPAPATRVEVAVMLFATPVSLLAFDAAGSIIARASSSSQQQQVQTLVLAARGIVRLELIGGSGKAAIIRLCMNWDTQTPPSRDTLTGTPLTGAPLTGIAVPGISAPASTTAPAVLVQTLDGDTPGRAWTPRVLASTGHCQLIEFRAPPGTTPEAAEITCQTGRRVTLISVCGTDQVQHEIARADGAHRAETAATVSTIVRTPATMRRGVLLDPGETYRIEVDWSWASWQSNEAGTNAPGDPAAASYTASPQPQRFDFAIAREEMASGQSQDGLNEHVFDPRDIARYIDRVEPVDGRSAHFLDDPLWVHFSAGHVELLLARHGRRIDLKVSRTDPPPQPSPALRDAALAPLIPLDVLWTSAPKKLAPKAWQRIDEALEEAHCIPKGPFTTGASRASRFKLDPLAMYDLVVTAPRTGGQDPVPVWPTRFITSRYPNPRALVRHLGLDPDGGTAPYPPADIIAPTSFTMPSGPLEVSDQLLRQALVAMDADTLPLPTETPGVHLVWKLAGSLWQVVGVLVDSLESLDREGATLRDPGLPGERAEITTRLRLTGGRLGSTSLTPVRATENATRLLLRAASPVAPPEVGELELDFTASDGNFTGRCIVTRRPAIIEREGL